MLLVFSLIKYIQECTKKEYSRSWELHIDELNSRHLAAPECCIRAYKTDETATSPVSPCVTQRAATQYFIFGLSKSAFSALVIQVEAKDLRERWAPRSHQERCGRLVQKTDFAAAHQVVQVPLRIVTHCCLTAAWRRRDTSSRPTFSSQSASHHCLSSVCRTKLTSAAEKESIAMFVRNLRQRLLVCPVRGCVIMGVDPGFKHGCKLAILSPTSEWRHWPLLLWLDSKCNSNTMSQKIVRVFGL